MYTNALSMHVCDACATHPQPRKSWHKHVHPHARSCNALSCMSHCMQAWRLHCTGDALHARFCTLTHNTRIAVAAQYKCFFLLALLLALALSDVECFLLNHFAADA
eukprot:6214118-Pleurochrysis_carterae.AAC.1